MMRIIKPKRLAFSLALLLSAVLTGYIALYRLPPLENTASRKVLDRNGTLLREVYSSANGRATIVSLDRISPEYLRVLLAIEDKRFFSHHGIDPRALGRALWQNLRERRIVSGGSTITQQLSRNLHPRRRTVIAKLQEAFEAACIELHASKQEILTQYCNRVCFGNNNFGIEAAARYYFGKSAAKLTISESAFLISLPQNPTRFNPFGRGATGMRLRHRRILERLCAAGIIDSLERRRAWDQTPLLTRMAGSIRAPHFTTWVLSQAEIEDSIHIRTSLDFELQQRVEAIVSHWVDACAEYHVTNGAAIVIDNRTGEILSYVGSRDFWDTTHAGEVDGVRSLRQPGSALKPFTYAYSLSHGYTAATLLPDIPTSFSTVAGDFTPLNYDRRFHGPVRLREALGCSYNVPVVATIEAMGVENVLELLRHCGFTTFTKTARDYGPGLTLGNAEVTLLELTRAYALFAREGCPVTLTPWPADSLKRPAGCPDARPVSPAVCAIIGDILADRDARASAFGTWSALDLPFRCSVKTGTTKDYKDNWTIGWAGRFTVGVWVGNFDGEPMQNVSGVSGAAPIFNQIMQELARRYGPPAPAASLPQNIIHGPICPLSGALPGPWCPGSIDELFIQGTAPDDTCRFHTSDGVRYPPQFQLWAAQNGLQSPAALTEATRPSSQSVQGVDITFPGERDIFKIDPDMQRAFQTLTCQATVSDDVKEIAVYVDDRFAATISRPFTYRWTLQQGKHSIRYQAAGNDSLRDEVRFTVLP
jgi:penicillin-binding protein 1C